MERVTNDRNAALENIRSQILHQANLQGHSSWGAIDTAMNKSAGAGHRAFRLNPTLDTMLDMADFLGVQLVVNFGS